MKRKTVFIAAILIISLIAFSGCGATAKEETSKELEKQSVEVNSTKPEEPKEEVKEEAPKQVEEQAQKPAEEIKKEEQTPAKEEEPAPKTEEKASGIRQELIDFLDSYEAVMNEYIEFMKNYKPNDITMLSKYTEILQKYTDFAQKAQAWENKDLNNEELIYYTKVLNRVNEKLLEVSLGN